MTHPAVIRLPLRCSTRCHRRGRQRAADRDMRHAVNMPHAMSLIVQSCCTSFAATHARLCVPVVFHSCRPSQPDRLGRSRQRSGKTEGKIKGRGTLVRRKACLHMEGAARALDDGVPSIVRDSPRHWRIAVPRTLGCATICRESSHERTQRRRRPVPSVFRLSTVDQQGPRCRHWRGARSSLLNGWSHLTKEALGAVGPASLSRPKLPVKL